MVKVLNTVLIWLMILIGCPCFVRALETVLIEGRTVEMIDDAPVPVADARITAIHDTGVETVSDADGRFRFNQLLDMGTGYIFYIVRDGYYTSMAYWNKSLSDVFEGSNYLEVKLMPIDPEWPTISGQVTMADGSDLNRVFYTIKDESGIPVPDAYGWLLGGLVDPLTGRYTFPIPSHLQDRTTFIVEAYKWPPDSTIWGKYPDGKRFGQRIARAGNTNADITVYPVTVISISAHPLDDDVDGRFDRVRVDITARAGETFGRFNGSPNEIDVLDEDDISIEGLIFDGENAWSYFHPAYENFEVAVFADVSEDHDVNTGYSKNVSWDYVKSSTPPARIVVENPDMNGFTLRSPSGNSTVYLPPAGFTGLFPWEEVIVEVLEIDPRQAGAAQITGSDILVVSIKDRYGNPVYQSGALEIHIPFDTEAVLPGALEETGRYKLFRTESAIDLAAARYLDRIETDQIVQIDRLNGVITFRTTSLGAFGIGTETRQDNATDSSDIVADPDDSSEDGEVVTPVDERPFQGSARSESSCFLDSLISRSFLP